ncbi:MAG TPA: Na+/H+ antiporter NhaA [Polyangiaceae bacterium]|nr:Na+/H+ antiporter NhaA [Polyangiaceae bacterium]
MSLPPEVWGPAHSLALRIVRPVERFLHVQAASGAVLLVMAVVALVWANSPWGHLYDALWHTPVVLGIGPFTFTQSLHFWINDGLMTIFFFVVGLEIRREIYQGELSELKRATLPIAAAVGGMIAPALIYLALNPTGPERRGWGVPMATDIAFAVGVLALLGDRVKPALRVLLLALAIIDDIGAILVIAIFYSGGVSLSGLGLAAGGGAIVLLLQAIGVRSPLLYIPPGIVLWAGMLKAGVHPTIAGVVLGLMTPARSWLGHRGFLAKSQQALDEFKRRLTDKADDPRELVDPLKELGNARREAVPPVVWLESRLHPYVAFVIMPLFALANAGVRLDGVRVSDPSLLAVSAGVAVGLLVGKPLGIMAASYLVVRLGIAALPRAIQWSGVLLVGLVAGIGFTMAIFVASLAFTDPIYLGAAKLAVLVGSAASAVIGLIYGRAMCPREPVTEGEAVTAHEAETSTEA